MIATLLIFELHRIGLHYLPAIPFQGPLGIDNVVRMVYWGDDATELIHSMPTQSVKSPLSELSRRVASYRDDFMLWGSEASRKLEPSFKTTLT